MALECIERHNVFITDRGGQRRLFEITDIAQVRWERVRDDVSEATITIASKYCFEQAELLEQIEPMRHEMVVYRNGERRWEGPVTLIKYSRTAMTITARDVVFYAARTAMEAGYDNSYPRTAFAISRMRTIFEAELARLEVSTADRPGINVIDHIVYHETETDARTSRKTLPFEKTVWQELDDLAARGGLDYTTVGRGIHLWDTSKPLGTTPTVTEADFDADVTLTAYGLELASRAIVTDGQGVHGKSGGVDPYYGLIDHLTTAYDETDGGDPPTSAEMASQAVRNLNGRNPVPMSLRTSDNAGLAKNTALTFDDLVPGVHMPLRAKILIRTLKQVQKLDRVTVVETPGNEQVLVTLNPASQPDEPEAE